MKRRRPIDEVLAIMARLRGPGGCPWDHEQDHRTLRYHAVEEVYEMIDAIDAGDDRELEEELGDLLLQVVFHCQLAHERGVFDFEAVCRRLADKLVSRHPHVFGDGVARTAGVVLEQWERLKRAEKVGTRHERASALDGIPRHLPALMRAQKLWKKAGKAGLVKSGEMPAAKPGAPRLTATRLRRETARTLFALARDCQERGWSAEELLREEIARREQAWRRSERAPARKPVVRKRG
ncbi:MAG: MazG family protein [Limisphaerales bacterium]